MALTWKNIVLLTLFSPCTMVNGHGYMYSPRSRNWVAHEDGTDSWSGTGDTGTPTKEYCYHCLNTKAADEICGVGNAGNYDEWLDINGEPIPWNSQATYMEGEIITVKSYLSTNHGGHMDLFVCADGASSTRECLEANPLEYIDSTHGAPKDVKYPGRGYYSDAIDFEMKFKLPMGVTGDKVMMQWQYVTGNSCMAPGYCCHDSDDYFDLYQNVSSWKRANTKLCTYPLDPTGATGTGKPELFWNCAEITIIPSNGQPTPSPVSSPTTPPPVSQPTPVTNPTTPPPVSGVGCCTKDFKYCSDTLVGWCSESKENCEITCMKWWLPNGEVEGCTARYEACKTNSDCCSPGFCTEFGVCESPTPVNTPPPVGQPTTPPPVSQPTTPSPVSSPTTPPVSGVGCCTIDFKACSPTVEGWCSESKENCEGPCDKWWLPNGAVDGCNARYESCASDSDCCNPGVCVSDSNGSKSCKEPTGTPSTLKPSPNPAPTTPAPTPPNANYCCSFDYKSCSGSSYCNQGQSECESSCQGLWIDDAPKQCVALYNQCSDSGSCCGPATCVGSGGYSQCQPGGSTSAPTPVPTNPPIVIPVPTFAPTVPPAEGCYSNNFKDCIPDGYSYASCNKIWLPNGAQNNCVALWGDCAGSLSSCCGPAECFSDGSYKSCIAPTDVTSTPTFAPTMLQSSFPTDGCLVKGEPCQINSDCCKNKCRKGKCKK